VYVDSLVYVVSLCSSHRPAFLTPKTRFYWPIPVSPRRLKRSNTQTLLVAENRCELDPERNWQQGEGCSAGKESESKADAQCQITAVLPGRD
jgi:hypothetical protein